MTALDVERLRQALDVAHCAIGVSDPNPRVGCIVGRADGTVLGTGWTQPAGGPHAEIVALREAAAAGHDPRGATAWVTLEPCAHHGRTPPCCDALVAAGVGRVVAAVEDPFPRVAGRGIERLRAAGVEVTVATGAVRDAARELNVGFFARHERGRPWVRLKVAASMDGRTALPDGASRWITGEAARADGHVWRKRASAVLTGIGTVLADDPRLDVRLVTTRVQPLRVVVDSALRLQPRARILAPPGAVLVATRMDIASPPARALHAAGAEILMCADRTDSVDLPALLQELARREVNELHVEAGATLNGAMLRAGLVDEVLVYVAPVLLGGGAGLVDTLAVRSLNDAPRFEFIDAVAVGSDLRLRARPAGRP